jgi:hypothetical protein
MRSSDWPIETVLQELTATTAVSLHYKCHGFNFASLSATADMARFSMRNNL